MTWGAKEKDLTSGVASAHRFVRLDWNCGRHAPEMRAKMETVRREEDELPIARIFTDTRQERR